MTLTPPVYYMRIPGNQCCRLPWRDGCPRAVGSAPPAAPGWRGSWGPPCCPPRTPSSPGSPGWSGRRWSWSPGCCLMVFLGNMDVPYFSALVFRTQRKRNVSVEYRYFVLKGILNGKLNSGQRLVSRQQIFSIYLANTGNISTLRT